jgi:RNA polymerase sigma-70 factor (ECF subfamily)
MDGDITATYLEHRALLFSIAYRMTGSVEDAEDITSEVFVRYRRAVESGTTIETPRAFLATTATRLAIDHLRSAHHNRETYLGPWLPEPLLASTEPDAAARVEVADSLSMAFLVLLESLTPVERAAFLLREVFQYDYADVAEIIGKSEANCRQLVRRANLHIADGKPRFEASSAVRDRIARTFFNAVEHGDLEPLVDVLAADVVAYGDGGGVGPSLPQPVHGRDRVIHLLQALSTTMRGARLHVEQCTVNGQPGATVRDESRALLNVLAIDIADGQVQTVRSIINPDKLRHLGPLLDPRAVLREARSNDTR